MARERSPNRDKAKDIYISAKGEIKLTDIAAQLCISDSQVRKWKSTDKWDVELNGALPMSKSNVTKQKGTKKQHDKNKKEPIAKEVEEVIESDGLTDKQRLFCVYYVKMFNATKAYQKAYGCDYVSAMTNGSRMLRNDKVRDEIEQLKAERMNGAFLTTDDLLQKYIDIAFADVTDYLSFGREEIAVMGAFGPLNVDGEPVTKIVNTIKLKESCDVDGTIISEVSQGKDGVKVKLADKMRALDFLAKNMGLLSFDVKEKLEIEREKLAIIKRKDAPDEEEIEDDGFIAALSSQVEGVWDDE